MSKELEAFNRLLYDFNSLESRIEDIKTVKKALKRNNPMKVKFTSNDNILIKKLENIIKLTFADGINSKELIRQETTLLLKLIRENAYDGAR